MNCLRRVAFVIVAMGLMSCAPMEPERATAPADPPVFDNLIVPGKRIGPLSPGMSAADLFRVLGPPDSSIRYFNSHIWGKRWVVLDTSTNRAERVSTSDPRDATREGLRVGSTELEMTAKLGAPTGEKYDKPVEAMNYCYSGIEFNYHQSDKITSITVSRGRGSC